MKIICISAFVALFTSCADRNISAQAAKDYCSCYEKYSDVYMDNDSLIVTTFRDYLRSKYEFIEISYQAYLNPGLAGKMYSFSLLDSVNRLIKNMDKYLDKDCPGVPIL